MDEVTIIKVADLLRKRTNQREYAADMDKRIAAAQAQAETHRAAIREINISLCRYGYQGE